MGFTVVSLTPHPLAVEHKVERKLIKVGVINYVDESGKEALFTYEDIIKFNKIMITIPIIRSSLSIIGCKYCYCRNWPSETNPNEYIKYVPEDKFTSHTYNQFKFKPNSIIRAEVKEEKAYAIYSKQVNPPATKG